MSYNAKNYTEQGGQRTVIGGELVLKAGATLTVEEGAEVGGLPQAAHQADSTATTIAGLVTDFNALLAKLQDAGLMAEE